MPDERWDQSILEEFGHTHRPLPEACLTLFREARLCHKAGAFNAAAMTCRAALEAATWHYLHLSWSGTGYAARNVPRREETLEVARSRLSNLRRELVEGAALDGEGLAAFDRVKDEGDAVAHVAEVTLRADEAELRLWTQISTPSDAKRDPLTPIWIDAAKSESLLRDTATVLICLLRASASRSRGEHPEWFRSE